MADKKITDLTDGGAVQDSDEFIVARSGSNNKISGSQIAAKAPVQSVFGRTGAVVSANGDYSGIVASSLTGATAATRYVGATTSGAPVSGSFLKGDFIITQDGHIYICTVAGSPGTWTQASGGSSSPLTTKGDVWGFNTVDARIPVGTNGNVLTADSTQALGLKWAAPSAAPSSGNDTLFTVASSGSALTVNYANGSVQDITLTAACTFTLSSPPAGSCQAITLILRQDATGSRTVTWPGSVVWLSGVVPTLHTSAAAIDSIYLFTVDGGTTWLGTQVNPPVAAWTTYDCVPTGFSGTPTQRSSRYTVIGNICFVYIDVFGTSNATTFTLTLPFNAQRSFWSFAGSGENSGTNAADPACASMGAAPSKTLTCYKDFNATAWTASGTKGIEVALFYEI